MTGSEAFTSFAPVPHSPRPRQNPGSPRISAGKPVVVAVVIRDDIIWDIGAEQPIATADRLTGQTIESNLTDSDPLFADLDS